MKKIITLLALTLLVACQSAPEPYQPAALNFAGNGQIGINVAEVRFVEAYRSPGAHPNVEQEFPTAPAAAVKQWIKQRIFAYGGSGVLEITLDDASVKEVLLPKTKGFMGLVTDDQEARYDASLRVTMRLYDGVSSMSAANGDVIVTRSRSINERATIEDRKRLYDRMTRDLMSDFDDGMQTRLKQYFGKYIKE